MALNLLIGQTLGFTGDPFQQPWQEVTEHRRDGAVLVEDGHIRAVGTRANLSVKYPQATVTDYGEDLIVPGFVDAHVHYPQTAIIASWGKRLIDWLNTYTFPEEMRLSDPNYAAEIAERYLDIALSHGTTTMASYCTTAPTSVNAYFEAAAQRGMRVVGGKTCMDRNAPEGLIDTTQRAYDESKALIDTWHCKGRAVYAITPRFSPTSTPEQLDALGALWAERPNCLMQTHLSEQTEEITWVRELFPTTRDYLDTYAQHGLLGARGVYGHAIHLEPCEIDQLAEVGASVIHCPTSNMFIGSGLFDLMGLAKAKVGLGLASDIGGGSNFSMLRTMAAAYEVAQLRGAAPHPAQLMWLASEGSAHALHLQGKVGHLGAGAEADLCVLNLKSTQAIEQRSHNANNFWEALFPTIMMGDDRAMRQVWVAGKPL
ncbi:guanine deaminase [uncultured Planktomarina sp.]|uniref:guanine deaminase n=1 Tax=uncultured Planktomarina sp. TaxID=1538529 RepID=UPI0032601B02